LAEKWDWKNLSIYQKIFKIIRADPGIQGKKIAKIGHRSINGHLYDENSTTSIKTD